MRISRPIISAAPSIMIQKTLCTSLFVGVSFAAPLAALCQDKAATSEAPAASSSAVTELKSIDRTVGTGRQVESGRAALVNYTGWLYDPKAPDQKGKQFDT